MMTAMRLALVIVVGVTAGGLTACASTTGALQPSPDLAGEALTEAVSPAPTPSVTTAASVAAMSASAPPIVQAVDVEVVARDLSFTPTQLEVSSVGTTRIILRNEGFVVHNLTVDALEIQAVAPRGGVADVTLTDPPPGTYAFYCSVSGHREAGMLGTLVVGP